MIRRLLIPLLGSGLLLAATVGSAFAKCEGPNPPEFCNEIIVDLNVGGAGAIFHAGTSESVVIDVSLGEQPYEATSVLLSFARVADGTTVLVPATASVRQGMWTADILLPNGGSWTVVAEIVAPDGAESSVPLNTIQVARAPDLPPVTTPVTPPPVAPSPPVLPIALLLAGIAAAAVASQLIRGRRTRRTAGAGAAASVATTAADRA